MSKPPHPTINWGVTTMRGKRSRVEATCPICHKARFVDASRAAQMINWGMWTGRCNKDRERGLHFRTYAGAL